MLFVVDPVVSTVELRARSLRKTSRLCRWFRGLEPTLPRILVLDGGVSTHLGDTFRYRELWSSSLLLDSEDQKRIRKGHLDWLEAGTNVLSTVTYQCHYEPTLWPKSKDCHPILTEERVDRMWQDAIRLGKEAIQEYQQENGDNNCFLVASSGCYGAALSNGAEYTGDYGVNISLETLMHFHQRKLQQVSRIDKNMVTAIETVPSIVECRALRQLLLEDESLPPCYVSFACRNGQELNDGTSLATALEILQDVPPERLVAYGLNCGHAKYLAELLDIVLPFCGTQRGIALYPNAGEDWDASTESWVSTKECCDKNTVDMLMHAVQKIASTRVLIGGCCRTTPQTTHHLKARVKEHLAP